MTSTNPRGSLVSTQDPSDEAAGSLGAQPRSAEGSPAGSSVAGSGRAGVAALVAVAVAYPVLWVVARPGGQPVGRFLGELCGAEAVLLFSCSLVLATVLAPIERAFGGLDRVAVWHRRAAVAGVLLLIPHVALVSSAPDRYATSLGHALGDVALIGLLVLAVWALAPSLRAARWPGPIRRMARASYERWLTGHRLTGLFVIVAVVHATIVDPVLRHSVLLRVAFLIVGAVGTIAYLYRELLARYVIPIYDYTVADVRRPNQTTLEVALAPVRKQLTFAPGQFVFLALGGSGGWQRHPFSVSSPPSDRHLELTIKASGDYTRDLYDQLRPGIPAKLAGPFGGFDYRQGGHDQIWIAGGIGVTPFLSWIRSIDGRFDRQVDFFYSVAHAEDAVDLDEIRGVADRHPSLRVHLVCADTDGKLTPEAVMHDASRGTQSVGLHVRAATDDARLLRRLPKARRPGRPHSLGAVRRALSRRAFSETRSRPDLPGRQRGGCGVRRPRRRLGRRHGSLLRRCPFDPSRHAQSTPLGGRRGGPHLGGPRLSPLSSTPAQTARLGRSSLWSPSPPSPKGRASFGRVVAAGIPRKAAASRRVPPCATKQVRRLRLVGRARLSCG